MPNNASDRQMGQGCIDEISHDKWHGELYLVESTDGGFGRRPEAALVLEALLQIHEPQVR